MLLRGQESSESLKNRKHDSICDKDEENLQESSKHNDKVHCDDKGANQYPLKILERRFSKVHDIERTKKIKELVEFEENSLTKNEKFVLGLVEDE